MSTTTVGAEQQPPPMAHRSWYLDRATADSFAAAVDDLHFCTRRPKHEVIAAALAVALEHRDAIEARLAGQDTPRRTARAAATASTRASQISLVMVSTLN